MIDDTKLLIKVSEPGEGIVVPTGRVPEDFILIRYPEDGRTALYESVEKIIWDCDKRPLTFEVRK